MKPARAKPFPRPLGKALQKRALAIRETALGVNHRDVGMSPNDLAVVYVAQAKYKAAEGLFERALAIREKVLGRATSSSIWLWSILMLERIS
jgi:tetratricopeptide repeat protein